MWWCARCAVLYRGAYRARAERYNRGPYCSIDRRRNGVTLHLAATDINRPYLSLLSDNLMAKPLDSTPPTYRESFQSSHTHAQPHRHQLPAFKLDRTRRLISLTPETFPIYKTAFLQCRVPAIKR